MLYHFPEKADLAGRARGADARRPRRSGGAREGPAPADARWAVVEGTLDTWLTHRHLLQLNLRDLALSGATPVFERFRDAMLRANALVAGPKPSLPTSAPPRPWRCWATRWCCWPTCRSRAARGDPRRGAGGARGRDAGGVRPRGRPSRLDPVAVAQARAWFAEGRRIDEIAAFLGVSRATAYRWLKTG
ncbi:MAG: helix-turn-helix domain-containing protein [Myxococcota bacterium]